MAEPQVISVELKNDKAAFTRTVLRDAADGTKPMYGKEIVWLPPTGAVALRINFREPFEFLSCMVKCVNKDGLKYILPFAALDQIKEDPPKGTALLYDIEVIYPAQSHFIDPVLIIQP